MFSAKKNKLSCSECDKKFDFPSQLRAHSMKHSGKRPYICAECGMDFMKVLELSLHTRYTRHLRYSGFAAHILWKLALLQTLHIRVHV